jgi:outer membrane protein assembly factor BamB
MCTAPIHAGGALIVPDHGSTLYGIDPAGGKQLWKLPGKSHPFQVPAKWTHQGREYVVAMTAGTQGKDRGAVVTALCLEPKTGKTVWEIELPPNPNKGVSIFGDMMYVTAAGIVPKDFNGFPQRNDVSYTNAAGTITAYRLTVQKAEQAWQSPATHAAGDAPPAVNGKYVVVGGPGESHLYDAATGKDLAIYKGSGPFNEGYAAFVEDRVVLSLDGSHGHSEMVVLGATPETFKKLCLWSQPNPQTTSYHNKFMTFPMVEGRIFIRGYDGVYCYDLRKKP